MVYGGIIAPGQKDSQREASQILEDIEDYKLVPRIRGGIAAVVEHYSRERDETLTADQLQAAEELASFLDGGFGGEWVMIPLVNILRYVRKTRIRLW